MIGWENVTSRIGHACRLGPELLKGRQLCVCHASTQRWTIREGNPRSSVYNHTCVTPSTCLSFASMLISGLMKKTFCILSLTCTASVYGLAPACFLLSVIQVSFSNSWGKYNGDSARIWPMFLPMSLDWTSRWCKVMETHWTHRVLLTYASKASNLFAY